MPVKLTAATLAKGFPLKPARATLSALVQGLAARREAEAREAAERAALDQWNADPLGLRNRRERLERQAAERTWDRTPAPKPRRTPRRRSVFGRPYTVVGSYRAKYGTWTKYMVDVIRGHANTADADRALRLAQLNDSLYPNKKLDWTWAEKVGLIRFD